MSESRAVAWKDGWTQRGVGFTMEHRKLSRGDRRAYDSDGGDSFTLSHISKHQIIHFKHAVIGCHLCLIEGDTSELCELGELLTFPSIIFLITEGTMNHAEGGG